MACFVSSPFLCSQYRLRAPVEPRPDFYYNNESAFEPTDARPSNQASPSAATSTSHSRSSSRRPRPSTSHSKASTTGGSSSSSRKSRDASPFNLPAMIPFMPRRAHSAAAAAEELDSDVEEKDSSIKEKRSARHLAPPTEEELRKKRAGASKSPSRADYFHAMFGIGSK